MLFHTRWSQKAAQRRQHWSSIQAAVKEGTMQMCRERAFQVGPQLVQRPGGGKYVGGKAKESGS